MTSEQSALLVAFVAFLGVVTTPIVTSFLADQRDRREKRHNYILSVVTRLIEVRSNLQYFQIAWWDLHKGEANVEKIMQGDVYKKMEVEFGAAYAIMISIDIAKIRDKAQDVIGENKTASEKLAAIDFALVTLGKEYDFFRKTDAWDNSS